MILPLVLNEMLASLFTLLQHFFRARDQFFWRLCSLLMQIRYPKIFISFSQITKPKHSIHNFSSSIRLMLKPRGISFFSSSFRFETLPKSWRTFFKLLSSYSLSFMKQLILSAKPKAHSLSLILLNRVKSSDLRGGDLLSLTRSISITGMNIKQDQGLPCPVPFSILKNLVNVLSSNMIQDKLSFK